MKFLNKKHLVAPFKKNEQDRRSYFERVSWENAGGRDTASCSGGSLALQQTYFSLEVET